MGVTLMHEHLLMSFSTWHHPRKLRLACRLRDAPVSLSILGELRMDPFVNLDNLQQYDVDLSAREAQQFADLGGQTILDPTNRGIGRDPQALAAISRRTGLNVVMGSGYYLEVSHPPVVRQMTQDDIAAEIERDLEEGVDGTGIRAGFIGEIGVSARFTPEEEKVLTSCRSRSDAQSCSAHGSPPCLGTPRRPRPGRRRGGRSSTLIMSFSVTWVRHGETSIIKPVSPQRGAYLEYDMISMDYYYADQNAQCPSDEENAAAIQNLIKSGYVERLLISQDVFLKMMLTSYGGFGYGYILRHFVPRLRRHGVTQEEIKKLLEHNPRRVFSDSGKQEAAIETR